MLATHEVSWFSFSIISRAVINCNWIVMQKSAKSTRGVADEYFIKGLTILSTAIIIVVNTAPRENGCRSGLMRRGDLMRQCLISAHLFVTVDANAYFVISFMPSPQFLARSPLQANRWWYADKGTVSPPLTLLANASMMIWGNDREFVAGYRQLVGTTEYWRAYFHRSGHTAWYCYRYYRVDDRYEECLSG